MHFSCRQDFWKGFRKICDEENIVLIFDEVMTGFRLAAGGAQERLNIDADLITYGKVIGGGMPVGAFGGRKEIMEHIAPLGNVYQAGTLSGNPIAMIAGLHFNTYLKNNSSVYNGLDEKGKYLKRGFTKSFDQANIPFVINQLGFNDISLHFCNKPVNDFHDASSANNALFNKFFHAMLKEGIYFHHQLMKAGF